MAAELAIANRAGRKPERKEFLECLRVVLLTGWSRRCEWSHRGKLYEIPRAKVRNWLVPIAGVLPEVEN